MLRYDPSVVAAADTGQAVSDVHAAPGPSLRFAAQELNMNTMLALTALAILFVKGAAILAMAYAGARLAIRHGRRAKAR